MVVTIVAALVAGGSFMRSSSPASGIFGSSSAVDGGDGRRHNLRHWMNDRETLFGACPSVHLRCLPSDDGWQHIFSACPCCQRSGALMCPSHCSSRSAHNSWSQAQHRVDVLLKRMSLKRHDCHSSFSIVLIFYSPCPSLLTHPPLTINLPPLYHHEL